MVYNEKGSNNDSDICDEENNDVVFRQVLAKFFDEKTMNLMEGLRSSKRKDDDDDDDKEVSERCDEAMVKDKGKGVAHNDSPEIKKYSANWPMSMIPDQIDEDETWDLNLMIMESLRGEIISEEEGKGIKLKEH